VDRASFGLWLIEESWHGKKLLWLCVYSWLFFRRLSLGAIGSHDNCTIGEYTRLLPGFLHIIRGSIINQKRQKLNQVSPFCCDAVLLATNCLRNVKSVPVLVENFDSFLLNCAESWFLNAAEIRST